MTIIAYNGFSQVGGSNIFEFQAGNLPYDTPDFLYTNYDQLNLQYRYKDFKVSGRMEYFINNNPEQRYVNLSQYQFRYSKKQFDIKAGHFYEMLGNGLLLRAYDIPAAIYEDVGYRVRHGFYRDMAGISAGYSGDWFHLKAVYGKPLINLLPPTVDKKERRIDELYALNPGFTFGNQRIDLSYLMNVLNGDREHFGSAQFSGSLPWDLSYNAEVAVQLGTGDALFVSGDSRHAIYSSLSWSGMNSGASLEFKDYSNFILGSGFNDPPTLVKEHSYKVLNRSTHVTQLSSEAGMQLEFYHLFNNGQMLTLNTSRSINEFGERYIFSEYFAEIYLPVKETASLKVFLDYARDPFMQEYHRYSAGSIYETVLINRWSLLSELEYQYFERPGFNPGDVHNTVFIAGVSKGSKFSASLTWELSTDIFQTDSPTTLFEVETNTRSWFGIDLKYKIHSQHTLQLFAGQRRGGPACASGICYEVLDFEGIEIRLTSKF